MALPGNPRGQAFRCTSPGNEAGRRRTIGVVATVHSSTVRPRRWCDAGPPGATRRTRRPVHREATSRVTSHTYRNAPPPLDTRLGSSETEGGASPTLRPDGTPALVLRLDRRVDFSCPQLRSLRSSLRWMVFAVFAFQPCDHGMRIQPPDVRSTSLAARAARSLSRTFLQAGPRQGTRRCAVQRYTLPPGGERGSNCRFSLRGRDAQTYPPDRVAVPRRGRE